MHMMYVDESGDPGFPASGRWDSASGGPSQAFVRAGVIAHSWRWATLDSQINAFKRVRGLTWRQEIKATDIRRGGGAFAGRDATERTHFLYDLLDTIGRELEVSIIAIHVDKTRVDTTQRKRFSDPSVRSMEILLEKYNHYLGDQKDRTGVVILDSIDTQADGRVRYFQNYLRKFSDQIDARRIVEGTMFLPSDGSNLLQIADICANVIYRNEPTELSRIQAKIVMRQDCP